MTSNHSVALPLGRALQEVCAAQNSVFAIAAGKLQNHLLPGLFPLHRLPVGKEVITLAALVADVVKADGEPADRDIPACDPVKETQNRILQEGIDAGGADEPGGTLGGGNGIESVADADPPSG